MIRLELTNDTDLWVSIASIVCMVKTASGSRVLIRDHGWVETTAAPETIADWIRRR